MGLNVLPTARWVFWSLNEFCEFSLTSFELSPGAVGTGVGCEIALSGTALITP